MTASRVPDVITAVVALFTANVTGATIIDGPVGARTVGKDTAAVGSEAQSDSAASATRSRVGWATNAEQAFTVICTLSSSSGGSSLAGPRARVNAMFDQVDTAQQVDATLGGVVIDSIITDERWSQIADENGVAVDLTFAITGTVYL